MATPLTLTLGAPGIYRLPEEPARALTGVRMDVCAFVGVAPRGPARELPAEPGLSLRRTVARPVESFDEYRRLYGGFEGPGLLPYAVASFFEQGGRKAYIARIVHEYGDDTANGARTATGVAGGCRQAGGGAVTLRARSEGSWGNALTAALTFTRTPVAFESATAVSIRFADDVRLPAGTRLECTLASGARHLRTIGSIAREGKPNEPAWIRVAALDSALPSAPTRLDVVEGTLSISDADGRVETFGRLGLSPAHPRWMASVLDEESDLALPDETWLASDLSPAGDQPSGIFTGGEDAYEEIVPGDFFDATWTLGDDQPGSGVHCLAQNSEIATLVVPDLYSPFPLAPRQPILDPPSLAGPEFALCLRQRPVAQTQADPVPDLAGLRLDPRIPAELAQISQLQAQLEEFAMQMRSFVVLLDVPPGLNQRGILQWRAPFQSAYVAAYHPWIQVARRDDERDVLVRIPPSGPAAGLIARSEIQFGVPHGPANALIAEAVNVEEIVPPRAHDELHQQSVNVYIKERDGIRLTAARTLARDQSYRQLSVRRLITMIRRTLDQQTQWLVFEPNNASLRADVRALVTGYLRQLQRVGAFRGATDEESFFVRSDDALNPAWSLDNGRLIAEIGVAPAEPLEFIVLRITRAGDGTLNVEE